MHVNLTLHILLFVTYTFPQPNLRIKINFYTWFTSEISVVKGITIFYGATTNSGPRPHHCRNFAITLRHTTVVRTSLNEWPARGRGRYIPNTQSSQDTNIHALISIRTRDPSNRAAADLRLRPHGHRDQLYFTQNRWWFNTVFSLFADGFGSNLGR
jgi:hypothetical protein